MLTRIDKRSAWTKQHAVVLSVIAILHFELLQLQWTNRLTQPAPAFESIVVLLTENLPGAIPAVTLNEERSTKPRRQVDAPAIELIKPDNSFDVPAADTNESDATQSIDWHAAANAAIHQSLAGATAKPKTREFGNSSQPQQAVAPQSLFTPPAHRFGDTTKTADDDSIVWLSERCYQVANSDVSHFTSFATGMPDTAKNYVRCKQSLGKAQSKSHLFEHLKHPPGIDQ